MPAGRSPSSRRLRSGARVPCRRRRRPSPNAAMMQTGRAHGHEPITDARYVGGVDPGHLSLDGGRLGPGWRRRLERWRPWVAELLRASAAVDERGVTEPAGAGTRSPAAVADAAARMG